MSQRLEVKEIPGLSLKQRIALLLISLGIIVFDHVTKLVVRNNIELFARIEVTPFWNWTLTFNQGAAFGLFANEGGWQRIFFGVLAFIVAVSLVFYILNKKYSGLVGVAASFILGGAVGNLIDRIMFGKVTDFIDWHYASHHWPAFNIADSFISIGVALLIIDNIFFSNKK